MLCTPARETASQICRDYALGREISGNGTFLKARQNGRSCLAAPRGSSCVGGGVVRDHRVKDGGARSADVDAGRGERRPDGVLHAGVSRSLDHAPQDVGGNRELAVFDVRLAQIIRGHRGSVDALDAGAANVDKTTRGSSGPGDEESVSFVHGGGRVRIGPGEQRISDVYGGGERSDIGSAAAFEREHTAGGGNRSSGKLRVEDSLDAELKPKSHVESVRSGEREAAGVESYGDDGSDGLEHDASSRRDRVDRIVGDTAVLDERSAGPVIHGAAALAIGLVAQQNTDQTGAETGGDARTKLIAVEAGLGIDAGSAAGVDGESGGIA